MDMNDKVNDNMAGVSEDNKKLISNNEEIAMEFPKWDLLPRKRKVVTVKRHG